jgi:NAD(P)-dependent dehydrogenase (short-subunit alcohol dehydrogenase family)
MKKILITGATGGLGSNIVRQCVTEKHEVFLASRNKELSIHNNPYLSSIDLTKVIGHAYIDFRDENTDYTALFQNPEEFTDIVICHGLLITKDILKLSRADLEMSMKVNYYGPMELCQFFLNAWTEYDKQDRTITFISSVASKTGAPEEVSYHSAKRAMEAFLLSVARKFASQDYRANVISPGLMDTEMGKKALNERPDIVDRIPLKRLTSTEEVATMVLEIMNCKSLTGQNLNMNGGRFMTV